MFRKRSQPRLSRAIHDRLALESLEDRRLLAGDFQPGDSNQDYRFDEADLIQVMKVDRYETGAAAVWTEGDWNKDGLYNSKDFVTAFTKGLYQNGPYDGEAGPAVHQLAPMAVTGQANVSIFYFPESGNLTAVAPAGMTAFHLVSRSGSFGAKRGPGLFDVANATSQFLFDPRGFTSSELVGLLPKGWTSQQVIDDLLVDGATYAGGGLGNVRLGAMDDFPAEMPPLPDTKVWLPRENLNPFEQIFNDSDPFVTPDQANGHLTYDPSTGDIRIESLEKPMLMLSLISPKGYFTGAAAAPERYKVGDLDVAIPERLIRWNLAGMTRVDYPGVARTGLTAEEFAAGVRYQATICCGLRLSLIVGPVEVGGAFQPGDSNQDYRVDEADVIQVLKLGKYETGVAATWAEGDWNKDGKFTAGDLTHATQTGLFAIGPYDNAAGPAENELAPLSVSGESDVSIFYFPDSGDVVAMAPAGMTAMHLVSRSGSFSGDPVKGQFNIAKAGSQFVFDAGGRNVIEHRGLLPTGWSDQQVLGDLLVDGAKEGGGGLGSIRLRPLDAFLTEMAGLPVEVPSAPQPLPPIPPGPNSDAFEDGYPFVSREEAHGILTYVPQTGDIRIRMLSGSINFIEISSNKPTLIGTWGNEERYKVHPFDGADPYRYIRFAPQGVTEIDLPGIARTGMTAQEFTNDVHHGGGLMGGGYVKLSLEVAGTPAVLAECEKNLANGAIAGDANLDGRFNTQDLVAVFRAGEYLDNVPGFSTWSEGDWTCDGEFDTRDLVAAFQVGRFDATAAAVALRLSNDRESVSSSSKLDDVRRVTDELDTQFATMRKTLHADSISTSIRSRRSGADDVRALATDEIMTDLELLE